MKSEIQLLEDICKFETRHGVQPSITACSFPKLNMWPDTVRPELLLSSPRTMGLLEISSHICAGAGPEDGHLKTAPPAVLGIVEKAAVGSALCQTGMGFLMQQPSTAELQCSTEKPAPPRGRQTQGIMQMWVNAWLTLKMPGTYLLFALCRELLPHSVGS